VSHQVCRKTLLTAALHSKLHFQRKDGESERWRRSSAGCERVQALAGEKRGKMLGESDREIKLLDTSSTALAGKQSGEWACTRVEGGQLACSAGKQLEYLRADRASAIMPATATELEQSCNRAGVRKGRSRLSHHVSHCVAPPAPAIGLLILMTRFSLARLMPCSSSQV
jgi:hypothetical protein